jgi:putative phosphoribosyl transferase
MFFGRPDSSFSDRRDAGRQLAKQLSRFRDRQDVVVLALPRGGVPVAFEVAQDLRAPLDVFIVRKLGVPGHEELAMGAIASGGTIVRNEDVIRQMNVAASSFEAAVSSESRELARREVAYRGDRPALKVLNRVVILVDDGIATGASMRAAVHAVQRGQPKLVIVAVPVAAENTVRDFNDNLALTVCVHTPEEFFNVGAWYDDFSQTSDKEVRDLLAQATLDLARESDVDFDGPNASHP